MADWFCQIDGREQGPFTSEQLRAMAAEGRITSESLVRRLPRATWLPASRVDGLFATATPAKPPATNSMHGYPHIRNIAACISPEEKKKRLGTAFVSVLLWALAGLLVLASFGVILVFYLAGWIVNRLMAEYNVRKLQAIGTEATPRAFPEVVQALAACCEQFGVIQPPKVIVLNDAAVNAFAIRFAKKRVIVLFSETLEGMLARPAELRFILGHELGHHLLDFGPRRFLELVKSASFRAARELTCDNCGTAAAGAAAPAVSALKRLGVGNALHGRLNDDELEAEARYIESGLTGWLLRQYMTYPPLGRRIQNVKAFTRSAESTVI